jgi:hypothetical protein
MELTTRNRYASACCLALPAALVLACVGGVDAGVEVGPDGGAPPSATHLVISPEVFEVAVGDSVDLQARFMEGDREVPASGLLQWSSSDPGVAAVLRNGRVTGIGGGEAIIRATAGTLEAGALAFVTAETVSGEPLATLTVVRAGDGDGTVESSLRGIQCGESCSIDLLVGAEVTLTASPEAGSLFGGWSSADCDSGIAACTIVMDGDREVTATFDLVPVTPEPPAPSVFELSVATNGQGTVVSSPFGIHCGSLCKASYFGGTFVTLTAYPEGGNTFAEWSLSGCSGSSCTVKMDANRQVSVLFK